MAEVVGGLLTNSLALADAGHMLSDVVRRFARDAIARVERVEKQSESGVTPSPRDQQQRR